MCSTCSTRLYHHRFNDQNDHEELAKFLGRCKAVEDKRNQIIHSHWEPDFEGGKGAVRRKLTAKNLKELRQQQETLSHADLEKVSLIANWSAKIANVSGSTLSRGCEPAL